MLNRMIMGVIILLDAISGVATLVRLILRATLSVLGGTIIAGTVSLVLAFILRHAGLLPEVWMLQMKLLAFAFIGVVSWKCFWLLEDHNPILLKRR